MAIIVFDIDGVLADSGIIFTQAINQTLKEMGKKEVNPNFFLEEFDVKNLPKTYEILGFEKAFAENGELSEEANNFYKRMIELKKQKIPELTVVKPDSFFALLKRRARIFLLSSSSETEMNPFLKKYSLNRYFDSSEIILGKREKAKKLTEISKKYNDIVYFIGDSHTDASCANEARRLGGKIQFIAIAHKRLTGDYMRAIHWSKLSDIKREIDPNRDIIITSLTEIFKVIPELKIVK